MADTRIVSWNMNGLRKNQSSTADKLAFLDNHFPNAQFDILILLETHHKDAEDLPEDLFKYQTSHHLIHTPTQNETYAGIVVLISKEFERIQENASLPGRLLNFFIKHTKTKKEYNFSAFYALQWKKFRKSEIETIIENFEENHDLSQKNVVLGDFNFAENVKDKGKGLSSSDLLVSQIWQKFTSVANLVDPFRQQQPNRKLWSYLSPNEKGKSRGDRVYVSEDQANMITNFKYIETIFQGSHKVMTFTYKELQEQGPGYWKFNSSLCKDRQFIQKIEHLWTEITSGNYTNTQMIDLFLLVSKSIAINHSTLKSRIKSQLKRNVIKQIEILEKVDFDNMTNIQQENYHYFKDKYQKIIIEEIRGHKIRTKGQPIYEINEPDIQFYAKLEKRTAQKNIISELQDEEGNIKTDNKDFLDIVQQFYTKLYTPSRTNTIKQQNMLKNIKAKLTQTQRQSLDQPITVEELDKVVAHLPENKSPGLDGLTAEFYKCFWYLIKDVFLNYIEEVKVNGFPAHRNTSVTTIIYKYKGETFLLTNYRPISLINIDIKILTKVLTNRLSHLLHNIIHKTQTAIPGRKIDQTIHLLRDLIDLANKEDIGGAFLFLDQEKAFDRVNHEFLFNTMETFGFGNQFINWVKIIYSNATTRIKINGHLTKPVPLKRGVRQGCPLSALLYALVIEVLAATLRANQNLVGFELMNEKIISLHYADDTIITILQNRCFKEVIKELRNYEEATGAKINYGKTKGLWVGRWKYRLHGPEIDEKITFTNQNVENFGLFFGNENPGLKTFEKFLPKVKRSMDYWKQFQLSIMAKSRIIEIFHASRLWYACRFYHIPKEIKEQLQKAFFDYINYPHKVPTVSQEEMKKQRLHGGIKLIDIESKQSAFMVNWLIDLAINEEISICNFVYTELMGEQPGYLRGIELFFTTQRYASSCITYSSQYYKNALKAITRLKVRKKVEKVLSEKLFHNPIFKDKNGLTMKENLVCKKNNIKTFGQLTDNYVRKLWGLPYHPHLANYYLTIASKDTENRNDHTLFLTEQNKFISFNNIFHKDLYEEFIRIGYVDHHSKRKWESRFPTPPLQWKNIWESLNSPIVSEDSKSIIWDQIHLNEYTTFSYNKWHSCSQPCPFCLQIPASEFHITLECPVVISLWTQIEPRLQNIEPSPVTEQEKVLGLPGTTRAILLRNWISFALRSCIVSQENIAFHNKRGKASENDIKKKFNEFIKSELYSKYLIYKNLNRLDFFLDIFTINDYILSWEHGELQVLTILP